MQKPIIQKYLIHFFTLIYIISNLLTLFVLYFNFHCPCLSDCQSILQLYYCTRQFYYQYQYLYLAPKAKYKVRDKIFSINN